MPTVNERYRNVIEAQTSAIEASLQNEQITRARVAGIEALLSRNFLGRLKWLITGR